MKRDLEMTTLSSQTETFFSNVTYNELEQLLATILEQASRSEREYLSMMLYKILSSISTPQTTH